MLYIATGKPAHLSCKFLSDVSVVNSPIVVELLVITTWPRNGTPIREPEQETRRPASPTTRPEQ